MAAVDSAPLVPPWLLFLLAGAFAALLLAAGRRVCAPAPAACALALAGLLAVGLGFGASRPVGSPPSCAVLLDVSQSMAHDGRLAQAQELIDAVQWKGPSLDARLYAFAEHVRAVPWDAAGGLDADGAGTRIGDAIAHVLDAVQDVAAIVLLSDGTHLAGECPLAMARTALRRHAPIYTVAMGERAAAPDGAIMAGSARRPGGAPGARIDVPVTVMISGPAPSHATVRTGSGEVLQVPITQGIGRAVFTLTLEDLPPPGIQVWQATLDPLPGETQHDNHTALVLAQTTRPETTLVLVEGAPSWEGTLLARGIALDPRTLLRSARALTPARPVLHGFQETDLPLDLTRESAGALLVLGEGWEELCRGGAAVQGERGTMLLARANWPGVAWPGPWRQGTLALTAEAARFPALAALAGRRADGTPIVAGAGTPLVMLEDDTGVRITVCALVDDGRTLAWGIRGALAVDDPRFFPRLAAALDAGAAVRPLSTDWLNYDLGQVVRIAGPAGENATVTGPAGATPRTVVIGPHGEAATTPPKAGLYTVALSDGTAALFAVAERTPERMLRRATPELLDALAEISGGASIAPAPEALRARIAQIKARSAARIRREVVPAWDAPAVFAALAVLMLAGYALGGMSRAGRHLP